MSENGTTAILQIPTLSEYKAVEKEYQNQLLRDLRQIYSDKDIRDKWGLKYNSFYYYLDKLKNEEEAWAAAGNTGPINNNGRQESVSSKQRKAAGNGGAGKSKEEKGSTQQAPIRQVIDAEYSVIEVQQKQQQQSPETLPMMNFVNVVGDIKQLEKRLNGILSLLEMEGEETRFLLNIQVYKA